MHYNSGNHNLMPKAASERLLVIAVSVDEEDEACGDTHGFTMESKVIMLHGFTMESKVIMLQSEPHHSSIRRCTKTMMMTVSDGRRRWPAQWVKLWPRVAPRWQEPHDPPHCVDMRVVSLTGRLGVQHEPGRKRNNSSGKHTWSTTVHRCLKV